MLEMREMIANTGAATDNDITDDATGAGRGLQCTNNWLAARS